MPTMKKLIKRQGVAKKAAFKQAMKSLPGLKPRVAKASKNSVATAGGGGMHQMGPARKTEKKLNAKQRTLQTLRKNKGKII